MVCDFETSALTTNFPTADWRLLRQSGKVCSPASLPVTSAPVGLERNRPSGVSSESSRPHQRRTSLVAGPRTDTVQDGCSGIQSPAWRRTKLSQFASACCRRAWSTSTSFCRIEPSANSPVQTVNRRRSSVSGRSSTVLEQTS